MKCKRGLAEEKLLISINNLRKKDIYFINAENAFYKIQNIYMIKVLENSKQRKIPSCFLKKIIKNLEKIYLVMNYFKVKKKTRGDRDGSPGPMSQLLTDRCRKKEGSFASGHNDWGVPVNSRTPGGVRQWLGITSTHTFA